MKSSKLYVILGLTFAYFSVVQTNDYQWSRGTKQYVNQNQYGGVPTGQAYSPPGASYGTTYPGSYSNGYSGNGYGSTQLSSSKIGVVLPQTFGYGFMGYDIYSLLGNGFYNMMGYALPQIYGLQSIPYLHPHALLQMQYSNLYGYQIHPFQQLNGHLDVYQRYGYQSPFGGYSNPFGGYTNGLWGFSPIGVPMPGLLGPRGNPMFGYKEPGFLERLGFHGVSKDIGKFSFDRY